MLKAIGRAFVLFLLHMGLILLLFTVLRVLFYFFNFNYFTHVEWKSFLGGVRFDWMMATLFYLPFILAFPFAFYRKPKWLKMLFLLSSAIVIVLNVIDFEYYKFTLKRTTSDLFTTAGIATDLKNLFFTFLLDYWYAVALMFLLFWLTAKGYNVINRYRTQRLSIPGKFIFFVLLVAANIPGTRGGFQYRPLNIIHASAYAKSQNMALVLNTPFTIAKSAFKTDLKKVNYFAENELEEIYNPVQHFDNEFKNLNVVVIIAESFSKEYIGALNDYEGYTPFLDSLINNGLVFTNAFANGKKSIESLPAILSGIPTLMNTSFITSRFASNRIESLPSILRNRGYETVFYHGGENGTMGFDAFSQLAGIERYVGKNQYPHNGDYDGNWGIFDEPFFQFCAADLNQMKQPFFASIFTLSSHHPYTIPAQYEEVFEGGPIPILKSIQYADYSLRKFFETISEQPWFENTLFVITADHTSQSFNENYNNPLGIYRIPLLFYAPKYIDPKMDERIAQQNDIYPSVIDFMGGNADIVTFGSSLFSPNEEPFAVSYLQGVYQIITKQYCLQYDGDKIIAFHNWVEDPFLQNNLIHSELNFNEAAIIERKLKAIIQQYNNRLIENNLIP